MALETITDWNGRELGIRRSRGKALVPYVEDWRRNVIGVDDAHDPPAWLLRQVRSYVARPSWFDEADSIALASLLGKISKFQSLQSEDALTWSWFGTLALAAPEARRATIDWLWSRLAIDGGGSKTPEVRQWPRVHHPNARTNGPEIDAVIDDPAGGLVYVEAKWEAGLGKGKGAVAGQLDDQIVLRRDSLKTDPALQADTRPMVVLGVSRSLTDLVGVDWEIDTSLRPVKLCRLTWHDLAACPVHPHAEEFERHLAWKEAQGELPARTSMLRRR